MIKHKLFAFAATAAFIFIVVGCGGNSTPAGTGSTGGGGGGGGTSSFALGGTLKINGGSFTGVYGAGTKNLVLIDQQGNSTVFNNVFVPIGLNNGNATILRAGSQLFAGTYGSKTAQCVSQSTGVQATVPLNTDGTLAKDTAIDTLSYLVMPVTKDGGLTFQNGVKFLADASLIGNNSKDVTIKIATAQTSLPTTGVQKSFGGSLSFSGGGTANTGVILTIGCLNAAQTNGLACTGETLPPSKSVALTGQINGASFATAEVSYTVSL